MDRYVAERRQWEPLVRRIAPVLGYKMDEVDRRGSQGLPATPGAAAQDARARAR